MHCKHFCKILRKGEHEGVLHMALESYKKRKFYCGQKTLFFPRHIFNTLSHFKCADIIF